MIDDREWIWITWEVVSISDYSEPWASDTESLCQCGGAISFYSGS